MMHQSLHRISMSKRGKSYSMMLSSLEGDAIICNSKCKASQKGMAENEQEAKRNLVVGASHSFSRHLVVGGCHSFSRHAVFLSRACSLWGFIYSFLRRWLDIRYWLLGSPNIINPTCGGGPAVVGVYPGSGIDDGGEIIRIFGSGFLMPTRSALHTLIHTFPFEAQLPHGVTGSRRVKCELRDVISIWPFHFLPVHTISELWFFLTQTYLLA